MLGAAKKIFVAVMIGLSIIWDILVVILRLALPLSLFLSSMIIILGYCGVIVPTKALYVVNPMAWLLNRTGIPGQSPGFFSGMAEGAAWPGTLFGFPVLSSMLVWYINASILSSKPTLIRLLGIVVACIAFQFTMQYAYLVMADRFLVARSESESKNANVDLIRKEADALSKALYISDSVGSPGIFFDKKPFSTNMRLAELQAHPAIRGEYNSARTVRIRIRNVHVTLSSSQLVFPVPKVGKYKLFTNFKDSLSKISSDIDVDELATLTGLDPLYYTAVGVAVNISQYLQFFDNLHERMPEKYAVNYLSRSPVHLNVIMSGTEGLNTEQMTTAHSGSRKHRLKVVATYDRQSRTLLLSMDDDAYRNGNLAAAREVGGHGTSMDASKELVALMTHEMEQPLLHELWHFLSHVSPEYKGLPLALDEGIAELFQTIFGERVAGARLRHYELINEHIARNGPSELPKSLSENLAQDAQASEARTEQGYRELIRAARQSGRLLNAEKLLNLTSASFHAQDDVLLLYAEGWALACYLFHEPGALAEIRNHLARVSDDHQIAPEDEPYWSNLTQVISQAPERGCPILRNPLPANN